jgi:hypothetical protein
MLHIVPIGEDEYDAVWFAAFMAEWQRRRAAATYDPPR